MVNNIHANAELSMVAILFIFKLLNFGSQAWTYVVNATLK